MEWVQTKILASFFGDLPKDAATLRTIVWFSRFQSCGSGFGFGFGGGLAGW